VLGPWLVTADEIVDPDNVPLSSFVLLFCLISPLTDLTGAGWKKPSSLVQDG
jgi:hypothetical protein